MSERLALPFTAMGAAGLRKLAAVIDRGHRVARRKGDELGATDKEKRVGGNQQRSPRLQCGVGCLDLVIAAGFQDIELHSQCAGRCLQALGHRLRTGMARLDQRRHAGGLRHQLVQEAQPLCGQLRSQGGDSGGVAARPIEAGDEAQLNRWVRDQKVDGNGRGRSFGCHRCRGAGQRRDHRRALADQNPPPIPATCRPFPGPSGIQSLRSFPPPGRRRSSLCGTRPVAWRSARANRNAEIR